MPNVSVLLLLMMIVDNLVSNLKASPTYTKVKSSSSMLIRRQQPHSKAGDIVFSGVGDAPVLGSSNNSGSGDCCSEGFEHASNS